MLRVDVDAHVGPRAQQVLEPRDAVVAVTDARLAHVRPAQLADDTAAIGDAVEGVVVERDEHAVDGGVHVGLDVAVAEVDRVLERAHGVLGKIARSALMGERNGAGMVEERPTRGHGRQSCRWFVARRDG